jgi:hypothetical protein
MRFEVDVLARGFLRFFDFPGSWTGPTLDAAMEFSSDIEQQVNDIVALNFQMHGPQSDLF